MPVVIIMLIGVVLAVFWVYQFTFLMALEDAIFSGKHDKALWCAAFILAPALTPFAFLMWRKVKRLESR